MPVSGTTLSERFLQQLGRSSFLSLWSHGNPYTPEGRRGNGAGKELCDLLVVFGDDVVIFSDKYIKFNNETDLNVAWQRWYKKAIAKSAQQIFGAEAWIRQFPTQVYADPKSLLALPVTIPHKSKIRIHRVCVAHGAYDACCEYFGGCSIGTLLIHSGLRGIDEHVQPFKVGHTQSDKGFVHVFDSFSLNAVLRELDTAKDLITYLDQREKFLSRDTPIILAAGEEQLLAIYLTNINREGEHAFVLPTVGNEIPDGVFLDESFWAAMVSNPQYRRKKDADQVSYLWDRLIEHFIAYAKGDEDRDESFELGLRLMASEPRIRRRQLGGALNDFLNSNLPGQPAVRIVYSSDFSEKAYVFLVLPTREGQSNESYLQSRKNMLWAYCHVAKLHCKDTKTIIGIAMSSRDSEACSEDFLAIDVSYWGELEFQEARALQQEAQILLDKSIRLHEGRTIEYPDDPPASAKNSDNKRARGKKENRKKMQRLSRKKNRRLR